MLAAALRAFFLWLSNRGWVARVALGTPLLRRMPLRFVAGTTLDQAVLAVRGLNDRVAVSFQREREHLPHRCLVFDEEDRGGVDHRVAAPHRPVQRLLFLL